MLFISSFLDNCAYVAVRVFSNFPLSGKTPYVSLPTTDRPDTAVALAESPSVKIMVQLGESFVPALFASSSFGMITLDVFFPSVF